MTPHSVYYHDSQADDDELVADEPYDIDSCVFDIVANAHKNTPSSSDVAPRLPFEKWKLLCIEDQQAWIALPASLRRTIMSTRSPKGPPPSRRIPSGLS